MKQSKKKYVSAAQLLDPEFQASVEEELRPMKAGGKFQRDSYINQKEENRNNEVDLNALGRDQEEI